MQKNIYLYTFYQKRDLIYKCQTKNIFSIPQISKIVVTQPLEKKENIFSCISSFILLFDNLPLLLQIKKTTDKKLKKTFVGVKCILSLNVFFDFFLRIKFEEKQNLLAKYLFLSKNHENFSIRFNIFDEFFVLYDKFLNLSFININFFYNNCYINEEKKLLVSNLLVC